MKRYTILLMVILGIIPQFAFSTKIVPIQHDNSINNKKIHPMEQALSSSKKDGQRRDKISSDNNRLLILLIGFQEEVVDDPNSTGNGQFQMEVPANYIPNISKPPHNQEYYNEMALAMKYYYSAASLGTFDLEWDIWPKDKSCYTLSQQMSYYNPVGASGDVFVSKMEEYFKESLELADSEDPEIVFSEYDHYMIIHAGSDWQHDVLYDSPVDIPSFFIRVGTGKEAVVDGDFKIDHACNIPETITQDIQEYQSGEYTIVTGYGALNGVMFHEFGHSMGLVDLYAVNSFQPEVGAFDIMDSGGGTEANYQDSETGKIVAIEGALPALPGAFSKELMFEQQFRDNNILKDLESLSDIDNILIDCAEQKHNHDSNPYIYKYQLNDNEYILIENKSVDPDGDGGAAIHSSLDGRISLYPTGIYDDNNSPTLEYDYLLPSYISEYGDAVGGGLLVWKVNEDILYNQGTTDSEGNFVSNFQNNYINTSYYNRGVEIIEADDIPDIGNIYARWWTGTASEYFFKNMPVLIDTLGTTYFTEWSSTDIHNDALNGISNPPLEDSFGNISSLGIFNISNSGATMSFSFGSEVYQHSSNIIIDDSDNGEFLGYSGFINGLTKQPEIAAIRERGIDIYYLPEETGSFDYSNTIPFNFDNLKYNNIIIDLNADENDEIILFSKNKFYVYANNSVNSFDLPADIIAQPIIVNNRIVIPTNESTLVFDYRISDNTFNYDVIPLVSNYILGNNNSLVLFDNTKFFIKEIGSDFITDIIEVELPSSVSHNHPIAFQFKGDDQEINSILFLTDNNQLYIYHDNLIDLVYDFSELFSGKSANIALMEKDDIPVILVANQNILYALYLDGTFLYNFPRNFFDNTFTQERDIKVYDLSYMNKDDLSNIIYLPVDETNLMAYNINTNKIVDRYSIKNNSLDKKFSYDVISDKLYQLNRFENSITINWTNSIMPIESILWDPDNNNLNRCYTFEQEDVPIDNSIEFDAYVFPNPVKDYHATLRIKGMDSHNCHVTIYSISGKKLDEFIVENNSLDHVDRIIDTSKYSSGVYWGLVSATKTKKFKFAVIK